MKRKRSNNLTRRKRRIKFVFQDKETLIVNGASINQCIIAMYVKRVSDNKTHKVKNMYIVRQKGDFKLPLPSLILSTNE